MNKKTVVENAKVYGLKKVITYLDSDPDRNIPKIINWAEKYDKKGMLDNQIKIAISIS